MKKLMMLVAMVGMFVTGARAQDLSGNWQGTLHAGKDLRIIVNFYKGEKDAWSAKMYSIDQTSQPFPVSSVTKNGSAIKLSVEMIGGSFEGKLSDDAKTITGTWTQGATPLPLVLVRATTETAWDIPAPPAPEKPMAADADPAFEVATIKPNDSGATGMQQLTIDGRKFVIRNGSLVDLIAFGYNVQKNQIVNGADWMDKDRYDIDAVLDTPGVPSVDQLRVMLRKLVADRFKLTFHHEKREMAAYVLAVGKSGQKLKPTASTSLLPSIGGRPATNGMSLMLMNSTIADFTGFLQMQVLDRPVVDQTGLTGRYDMTVTFTPSLSEFHGHPPAPPTAEGVEPAPALYDAVEQQLGLKLSQEKTAVDVIAIDHVEKPSAN